MIFKKYSELQGKHAFLGASKYHWINYDEQKIIDVYIRDKARAKGTELHEFAARCIDLNQKLPRSRQTLNMYVNDAIGYKMKAEQVLCYSPNCYGTADAISFRNNFLRIHDYKSGVTPAHMQQLLIYVALFCLDYMIKPSEISMECRIYQNDDITIYVPTVEDIVPIMDKIVTFDKAIQKIKREEEE